MPTNRPHDVPDEIRRNATAIKRAVRRWGRNNFADYPWRTEDDEWLGLAVEVMLQRTRATTVARIYPEFRRHFPTAAALDHATESELESVIGPIGLRWRIRALKVLSSEIVVRGGSVPHSLSELKELTGVAEYVASAFVSLHLGRRAVLIDANVTRWIGRLAGRPVNADTRRQAWLRDIAEALTPNLGAKEYNYAVLDFTMNVCGPSPTCQICPVKHRCVYGRNALSVGITPD